MKKYSIKKMEIWDLSAAASFTQDEAAKAPFGLQAKPATETDAAATPFEIHQHAVTKYTSSPRSKSLH